MSRVCLLKDTMFYHAVLFINFHFFRNQACHDEDEDDDAKNLAATLRSRSASLPRHIVPGISLPTMAHDTILFAPKCLVLISRHDFPEAFRNTLGVIYTVYSECMVGAGGERIKLETLVGNLLGHIYVPRSGGHSGSQVRFTLGKNSYYLVFSYPKWQKC